MSTITVKLILMAAIPLLLTADLKAQTDGSNIQMSRKALLLQVARNSVGAENFEAATQRFYDYLKQEPTDGRVALELAVLLYQIGKKDEAIGLCKETIGLLTEVYDNDPSNTDIMLQQAHLTRWIRDFWQADTWYKRYLEIKPDDKQVRLEQARLAGWDMRYDNAIDYYSQMVEDFPKEKRYELEMKAKHNNWLGRPTKASRYYIETLAIEPNEPEMMFDLGQMYSRRGFALRAQEQYRRILDLVDNHSMAPAALLAEQWRRRQYAKVKQSYVSKKGRGSEVGIKWWRTDLTYAPDWDDEAEATEWLVGIGRTFFSFDKHSSTKADHVNVALDKRYDNTFRILGKAELSWYDRRPDRTFQFAGDFSYRIGDVTEIAFIVGQEDVLESFDTLDIELSRYYHGGRIVLEPFDHTEVSAQIKKYYYSDKNRGTEYDLRVNHILTKYPKILRLTGRLYGFDVAEEKEKYWTPSNYSQAGWGLSWYHYFGTQHFEEAEKLYYFLEGFMTLDNAGEPGTDFKAGIMYDSNRQWSWGVEYGMSNSDVYEATKGMAFIRYRW